MKLQYQISEIEKNTALIIPRLRDLSLILATAESCTGGLLAHCFTNIPGASDVFKLGLVTYSNASKMQLLDIPLIMLEEHGAASKEVAMAMAEGVREKSGASFGLATTGIAGPTGGNEEVPVGTLYLAIAQEGKETVVWKEFFPSIERLAFKEKGVDAMLKRLYRILTPH
ncbi:MAG: CinA family protein [Verrucomicrobia bacterium]|jgi:nicotinamide-nucleotide amidase|nr:MAG: CinA family protein [Verrucomicrobiota bacterium]